MYTSADKNNSSFRAKDGNMALLRKYQTTRHHIKREIILRRKQKRPTIFREKKSEVICVLNYAAHNEYVVGCGGIIPHILKLCIRQKSHPFRCIVIQIG
jgi:hypothetical protein